MLCLCRARNPNHPGFRLRRTSQRQRGICWYKGVRHTTVDADEHHVWAPCAATGSVWCVCAGWKQWLPPDKVQLEQKALFTLSDLEMLFAFVDILYHLKRCWSYHELAVEAWRAPWCCFVQSSEVLMNHIAVWCKKPVLSFCFLFFSVFLFCLKLKTDYLLRNDYRFTLRFFSKTH